MNIIEDIHELIHNPYRYGEEYKKETRKKVVGYFCSYTPEEVIFAADALPFRIFGVSDNIQQAESHLQAYCCSLVRRSLEDGLSGRLDFLDGIVFPHTCDSMQRLSDIWRMNLSFTFHFDVVLPVKLNTESAMVYFKDVIKAYIRDLEYAMDTDISDVKLKQSISIFNRIRSTIQRIYEIKRLNPDVIKGSDVYSIVRASMIMDRHLLLEKLLQITAQLEANKNSPTPAAARTRIVLTGGNCTHADIYDIIEDAGAVVVWDDLCTGSRLFEGMLNTDTDPITAITERYFERVVCPAKHANLTGRAENLIETVKQKRADGVIFLLLKFCDPHAFDYPYLKGYLDKEGIPSMLLEMEDQFPSPGQLKTRIEAFLEII